MKNKMHYPDQPDKKENGIVIHLRDPSAPEMIQNEEAAETAELVNSCRIEVTILLQYTLHRPDPATLIRKGKLAELQQLREETGCNLFIFNREIAPGQKRNLEKALQAKVIGKTELILDIFARRARTAVAKLQVELAQLEFTLPRLTGMWTHLAKSQGGVGFRGPGEKQLEMDRRQIKTRISHIKSKLEKIQISRQEQRKRRWNKPKAVIVGYTNAGKSTLINKLAKSELLAADMPFASLDSSTREVYNPHGPNIIFSDTVGFIKDLPHTLVEAFKATLEEVGDADLIILTVDAADIRIKDKIAAVHTVLNEIGCAGKQILYCFNKIDLLENKIPAPVVRSYAPSVQISAVAGTGLDQLKATVISMLQADCPRTAVNR